MDKNNNRSILKIRTQTNTPVYIYNTETTYFYTFNPSPSFQDPIKIPAPAILKPKVRWTGKQVISALLSHICRPPLPPLHLDGKARTPASAFGNSLTHTTHTHYLYLYLYE